jgi:mannan endo-1,4-beta-mannosidase
MTEVTFTGTVTIDGTPHQVNADLTATGVTPPAGGGGTTPPPGGGGGSTTPPPTGGGGTTPPPSGGGTSCIFGIWDDASVNWNTADGNPVGTWAGAQKFSAAPVKSVTYFTAWLGPFPTVLNQLAGQNGATVYLNLEPWNTWGGGAVPKMTDIAKGSADSYLTSIGNAIKAGGNDVWVTFAHEMNGTWYPWGIQAVTPAQWVTTWKHVCDVIRAAAGGHAKMVWCPNNNDVGPVTPYWPGAAYVDIAGFDGYLNQDAASQTYGSFVAPTVAEIRKLAGNLPIWNAETGVNPGTGRAARYAQFIADMHSDGLAGFTQWNEASFLLTTAEVAAVCAAVNKWNAG